MPGNTVSLVLLGKDIVGAISEIICNREQIVHCASERSRNVGRGAIRN